METDRLIHDINNDLSIISMALCGSVRSQKLPHLLDRIANIQYLIGRVQTRHHKHRLSKSRRMYSPSKLVESLQLRAVLDGCEIKIDHTHDDPVVLDHIEINRVLQNLIINAIEVLATKITVNTFKVEDRFILSVADNGPGVPSHLTTRIFHQGFSNSQKEGASGLGLSICKQIVEAHDGRINYYRNHNHSIFTATIPQSIHEAGAV